MIKIQPHADLSSRNTFGMKVFAQWLIEYDCAEDLHSVREKINELGLPYFHIGGGSNLLFTQDFHGVVLHSNIRYISMSEGPAAPCHPVTPSPCHPVVTVGSGIIFDDLCEWAAQQGLWGLENLSGIPGEVGAAAVQNIGAYGVEVKDVIEKVYCYDIVLDKIVSFTAEQCGYGYRDSLFKTARKGRYIVTAVSFRLSPDPAPRLEYGQLKSIKATSAIEVREAVLSIRDGKLPDPKTVGSAGSFFKNPVVPKPLYDKVKNIAAHELGPDFKVPSYDAGSGFVKIPAAFLIEQCGFKGVRRAQAGTWPAQPLVIVNYGGASAEQIVALEKEIIDAVQHKYDITLSPEVEHL